MFCSVGKCTPHTEPNTPRYNERVRCVECETSDRTTNKVCDQCGARGGETPQLPIVAIKKPPYKVCIASKAHVTRTTVRDVARHVTLVCARLQRPEKRGIRPPEGRKEEDRGRLDSLRSLSSQFVCNLWFETGSLLYSTVTVAATYLQLQVGKSNVYNNFYLIDRQTQTDRQTERQQANDNLTN